MEWLMIIAFIVISIMDSKKKSEQAKQQREKRQKTADQPVYRTETARTKSSSVKPKTEPATASSRETGKQKDIFGSLGDLLGELENWAESIDVDEHPAKPSGTYTGKKTEGAQAVPVKPVKKKSRKPVLQAEKKTPGALPTKTLMEMRPDREQRAEHTKVTASVKPLKNAYENDENCEHRIELNPNIQYSKQKQKETVMVAAAVKTDQESLVQGIIWSEILGKPKAYQPNQPKFYRR